MNKKTKSTIYYNIRSVVRIIVWGAVAFIPYLVLPKVSGFYILAGEIAVLTAFAWFRFREPHTPSDTPIYDSMVRDYGDPLK